MEGQESKGDLLPSLRGRGGGPKPAWGSPPLLGKPFPPVVVRKESSSCLYPILFTFNKTNLRQTKPPKDRERGPGPRLPLSAPCCLPSCGLDAPSGPSVILSVHLHSAAVTHQSLHRRVERITPRGLGFDPPPNLRMYLKGEGSRGRDIPSLKWPSWPSDCPEPKSPSWS